MNKTFIHLTKPAAEKLRLAFRGAAKVSTADLLERLEAMGYKSRNYRYNILSDAFALGMVYRQRTDGTGHLYTLTPNWTWPLVVPTRGPRAPSSNSAQMGRPHKRPDPAPAAAYEGPAFGDGLLAPSVGHAFARHADEDGEVTPFHGGQIVDALHRQFDAVFLGAE